LGLNCILQGCQYSERTFNLLKTYFASDKGYMLGSDIVYLQHNLLAEAGKHAAYTFNDVGA